MSEAKKNEAVSPERLELESMDIVEYQNTKLRELFPEVFTDGAKVDFEKLKKTLGEAIEEGKERYGLNWSGKSDCYKTIQRPCSGTLVPLRDRSVNFDKTQNVIIEGDNLEVLKLLQKSYLGKIKLIYIDPPYNTGSDFIYPDDFSETLETYLQYTGQLDQDGRKFSNNLEIDGRFHSKWLSMMYPRLFLARNLLKDDGLIFISIDDKEVSNLRKICDEIFGEENFLSQLVWKKKYIGGKHATHFVDFHEYVLVYAKIAECVGEIVIERPEHEKEKFEFSDEYESDRGKYYSRPLKSNLAHRPTLIYPIVCPDGSSIANQWMVAEATFRELVKDGRIIFKKNKDERYQIYRKFYERDGDGKVKVPSLIDDVANADGKIELKKLFNIAEGRDIPFDNPKPTGLIKYFLRATTSKQDIILDFFAGSGTTGHSVLDLNQEDGGEIKFILIQLPEPTEDQKTPTISDICEERIRRVVKNIEAENAGKSQASLFENAKVSLDNAFRSFKLTTSNFKAWNLGKDPKSGELAQQLPLHVSNVEQGRNQESIFFELLLKSGFELSTRFEKIEVLGKTIFGAQDGALLVCLEKEISKELVNHMASLNPIRVICLDFGFAGNDQLKVNTVETFKAKSITFKTV